MAIKTIYEKDMKIILSSLFLLLFTQNNFAQNIDTTFHENGAIKSIGARNELRERIGLWKTFFDDGKPKSIVNYQKGKEHGKWITYHSTGNISSEGNFKDGSKVNEWKYYYPSGKIKTIVNYNTGEMTDFEE